MSTLRLPAALLGGLALVAGAVAYLGRADPGLSGGAAAMGAGAAAVCAVMLFAGETGWDERHPRRSPPGRRPEIRTAFRSGPLGRQAIVARIHSLERSAGTGGPVEPSGERALLRAPSREFLDWVEDRIRRLEEST